MPQHVAMIMDGNGRWAESKGKPRLAGHEAGAETVRRVLDCCQSAGIKFLTLYAFSKENWLRSEEEVAGLMSLLSRFIKTYRNDLIKRRVRLRVIGDRKDLSSTLQRSLASVEQASHEFEHQLIVALSYSGRSELINATRLIAQKVEQGLLLPDAINETTIQQHLYAPDVPDPDLIIRTSGEMRLSNFLLWQGAYSEFYVTPVLWPDFKEADFTAALDAYALRDRRYGGVKAGKCVEGVS